MKLLVGVKRVVDYAVKIRVLADKTGVDLNNIKMSLNPFCEIAIGKNISSKEVFPVKIGYFIYVNISELYCELSFELLC